MSIDAALDDLNARLKAGKKRCVVQRRGGSLYLRATLPERDNQTVSSQQRIALALPAEYTSLPEAESKALALSDQLRTKTFVWEAWETTPVETLTVPDFLEAAKALHTSKYRKDPERGAVAWNKKWRPALNKLPPSGPINESVLLRCLRKMPEGSAARRDQGNILTQVAKSMGLPHEPMLAICRGYGADKLQERDIPTDIEIEHAFDSIRLPHWQWTWGMLAAFGLRPHEVAELAWLEEGWIEIHDRTKTGTRRVTACPSAWIERFALHDLPRPTQSAQALSRAFSYALERDKIAIKPYNLRHGYALRLMTKGVSVDLAARLMGHSVVVHQGTYQRWIEADRIQRAMSGIQL